MFATKVVHVGESAENILATIQNHKHTGWNVREMIPSAWTTDGDVRYVSEFFIIFEA